jgi:tetratricopeptide (TPR) repeat protein
MKKLISLGLAACITIHCSPPKSETGQQANAPIAMCGVTTSSEIIKLIDTTRQIAPQVNNLGNYSFKISTQNPDAQSFFDQGLNLYYGFNHLEAFRSFREAARLDPKCAMCWWGQALALGPNINSPMDPSDAALVYKSVNRAKSNSGNITEVEKELIRAIAARYTQEVPQDRSPLDRAYANAMQSVASLFPSNDEVITLLAESLMDLHPWDYWLRSGEPQPWTPEITGLIDKVIKRSPKHPGANHLNIHIREASTNPGAATYSADLLRDLVPGSGHLVHMPSHIYIRTGRYADGILANQKAVKADNDYISQCRRQGLYPLAYYPHNYHFYWACAQMSGRGQLALDVARELVSKTATNLMGNENWLTLQHYYVTPWYSMVRFKQWEEIKREPKPADSLKYAAAIWNYARGLAALETENAETALVYLDELKRIASDSVLANQKIWGINSFGQVLTIAAKVFEGEWLARQKKYDEAIYILSDAIRDEDSLLYQEPADWYYPVRQTLGNVYLKAARYQDAEKCFRNDLRVFADNGWSLSGLYKALSKQGKTKEAAEAKARFEKAFADADAQWKSL